MNHTVPASKLVKLNTISAWELLQAATYPDGNQAVQELGKTWGRLTTQIQSLLSVQPDQEFATLDRKMTGPDGREVTVVLSGADIVAETRDEVTRINQNLVSYPADGRPAFSMFESQKERANMLADQMAIELQAASTKLGRLQSYMQSSS